jgi:hypothetical protein
MGRRRRLPESIAAQLHPDAVVSSVGEVDASLRAGDLDGAGTGLSRLGALLFDLPPTDANELRRLLQPLRERLDQARRNLRYRGTANPGPRMIRCSSCGSRFSQHADEAWRKRCHICEPPRDPSVRAASAGLPTLGKRRP